MKTAMTFYVFILFFQFAFGQINTEEADKLKKEGLLMPALMKYASDFSQSGSDKIAYKIASTSALLWTEKMRDTSFYFLNYGLKNDATLTPLYDPDFLSLIDDPRWNTIVDQQIRKFEKENQAIPNREFAKELFRMIIKDQGFMYAGNIEREKYLKNGGYFSTPAIFPVLAAEAQNKIENEKMLIELLDKYGWPTTTEVTEYAAAGAALIINHSTYELRSKYFPKLEEAFKKGEAQPLRYAKMRDRLLVEEGKEQLYGTQIKLEDMKRELYPIYEAENVDHRRAAIGLGPLSEYLKARFDMDWQVTQK